MGSVVVIGGTAGLGREIADHYVRQGRDVVLSGRDAARAAEVARELGGGARGIGLDLAHPHKVAAALSDVDSVDHLVLAAIERDRNTAVDYRIDEAVHLVTLKLVGYTAVASALHGRLSPSGSILLFGGQARVRPYPGSTTVTTVNGGVVAMVTTLALEFAPIRVNAIHPGIVGDSPMWRDNAAVLENVAKRTPIGRAVTMDEIVGACLFLLENGGVNGVNLAVDGGSLLL
jgi:NAD(P)-dependent dehydrogenase (short-subunit alcohol dehydrogenase family)